MTRVYVPATVHLLAKLDRTGSLSLGDDVVLAPDDSEEEEEYDALMTAAETAAVLAGELDPGDRRRVVIVAEMSPPAESLTLADVVAVHADADDLPPGALPDELDELDWYATQEIPDLLNRN